MTLRNAARAILLTEDLRILLMKLQEPVTGSEFWITPGGAVEASETSEEGLRREIVEETGLSRVKIGPPIWKRRHDFTWNGKQYRQKEVYYYIKTTFFDPSIDEHAAPGEYAAFRGFKWWSLDEIKLSEETFVPRNLHALLRDLVRVGPPEAPFDVGV